MTVEQAKAALQVAIDELVECREPGVTLDARTLDAQQALRAYWAAVRRPALVTR